MRSLLSPASTTASLASPAIPKAGPTAPERSAVTDTVKVAFNFTQTLMKKVPDLVDANPVKTAFGLAKVVIEIKDAVRSNMDAVDLRIASTADQLLLMDEALADSSMYNKEGNKWAQQFKGVLEDELAKLRRLSEESRIRKIADHEEEKRQISGIFEKVNAARIQFELGTGIAVFRMVDAIHGELRDSLWRRLDVSRKADHKYNLADGEDKKLKRDVCTPGTRVRILGDIVDWANGKLPGGLYWLFGPAGSGKSTIACTIARRFELTCDPDDTIVLGGNFFSSREFPETRNISYIVRTI
ncbi:hypothetical protein FA15DRAFT_711913, partial [Coprinopsis marcescibilis]